MLIEEFPSNKDFINTVLGHAAAPALAHRTSPNRSAWNSAGNPHARHPKPLFLEYRGHGIDCKEQPGFTRKGNDRQELDLLSGKRKLIFGGH